MDMKFYNELNETYIKKLLDDQHAGRIDELHKMFAYLQVGLTEAVEKDGSDIKIDGPFSGRIRDHIYSRLRELERRVDPAQKSKKK